jgi:hypothetical protein
MLPPDTVIGEFVTVVFELGPKTGMVPEVVVPEV